MAFYYVKNGGTATGDGGRYATAKTGSWATAFSATTEYYGNIQDAAKNSTTTPDSGDVIYVSDTHSHNYTGNAEYFDFDRAIVYSESPISIVVVDNDDVAAYAKATSALETVNSTYDIAIVSSTADDTKYSIFGLNISSGDDMYISTSAARASVYLHECTFSSLAALDVALLGARYNAYNCTINANGSTTAGYLGNPEGCVLRGCTFATDSVGTLTNAIARTTTSTPEILSAVFEDCDFSGSRVSELIETFAGVEVSVVFKNCALPSTMTAFWNHEATSANFAGSGVLATGCSSSAGGEEYQYFYNHGNCTVEDDTSFYRDGSTAFPSGQKVSLKCVTGGTCDPLEPFSFVYPSRYVEFSNTASDSVRIHFLSSDSGLTDADVSFELRYPDGTNTHLLNRATSVSGVTDPLRTGTALSTSTEAWTGRTTETRYYADLDTSGDVGGDGIPSIYCHVKKANTTIYFCPTLELS